MLLKLQELLLSNGATRVMACLIGFICWSILNESHKHSTKLMVPVSFYHVPEGYTIEAPEQIQITVMATLNQLRNLDTENLALHIDGSRLCEGMNAIDITAQQLLLPPEINLVKYKPVHIIMDLKS